MRPFVGCHPDPCSVLSLVSYQAPTLAAPSCQQNTAEGQLTYRQTCDPKLTALVEATKHGAVLEEMHHTDAPPNFKPYADADGDDA